MIIDNNLFSNLTNGYYSLKGAIDSYGRLKILVFSTQTKKYFFTDAWHDSTKWAELGQFETVSKDLNKVESLLKDLGYTEV